jgi:hypothetical protein
MYIKSLTGLILVGNDAFTPGDCQGSNSSILSKSGFSNDQFNYGSYLYLYNYIWVYKQETIAILLFINYSIHFTMCSVMCHTRVKNYDKLVIQ